MADKSKPSPPTDVSPGSVLPPGDHYETGPLGTKHTKVRLPATAVGSAYVAASVVLAAGSASVSATAVSVVDRQTAILALEPKVQALHAAILHAIVAGTEPAGPHLGNPDFSEDLLKEFARYEQGEREAKSVRQEAARIRRWSLTEKILVVVVSGAVGALIAWAGLS
jgi:hypothetical protein